MSTLINRHCIRINKGSPCLSAGQVDVLKTEIRAEWSVLNGYQLLEREFKYKNYYETIAFVNAIAWIAHREDHHPELVVGYNRCLVRYSTHAANGLTENDFICAAHIDAIT